MVKREFGKRGDIGAHRGNLRKTAANPSLYFKPVLKVAVVCPTQADSLRKTGGYKV